MGEYAEIRSMQAEAKGMLREFARDLQQLMETPVDTSPEYVGRLFELMADYQRYRELCVSLHEDRMAGFPHKVTPEDLLSGKVEILVS